MGFVLGLPKISREVDMVCVVIDKFTKMAHFIPCKSNHDASYIVNIFFKEVGRVHGLHMKIVTNRDTKFIGHFCRTLWKKLSTHLDFSSAYHPRTDGQTKVVNSVDT